MPSVTSKDGTTISFTQAGTGPALILVGGALQTREDHLMGKLLPLLAKHFTVISYDRRGRGGSSNTEPYAPEREVEDLAALVQQAGGSAYVFGNSSGGNLALLAAASLPGITKVATYEAPFIPEQHPGDAAAYIAKLEAALSAGKRGKAVKLFLKRIGMPGPMITMASFSPMWAGMKALAPTLLHDAHIANDGSVPKKLAAITAPVTLITGTSPAMKDAAKSVQKVITTAQLQTLPGQTHDVNPELLAAALTQFFHA